MSDIKLFRLTAGKASELQGDASDLEKPLQNLIEANLEVLLGIRFLATEYSTGKTHAGRIDSLGIDENHCPVILEYKRSVSENVINQGLFYLDWLMDHKAEFELLVMRQLGQAAADAIDWSAPRVVCIAGDFTKFDAHAVQQIGREIELIRYRRFGTELLLLEAANTPVARKQAKKGAKSPKPELAVVASVVKPAAADPAAVPRTGGPDRTYAEWLPLLSPPLRDVLESLEAHVLSLGDDVQRKELRLYVAFKRLKNFATVVPQKARLQLYLNLDPAQVGPLPANGRDVSQVGHWGTGDVELVLSSLADLDAAKPLILMAYEGRGR